MSLFGFNTQPPEGGWQLEKIRAYVGRGFNTQPPEGGWTARLFRWSGRLCFNTQPPEGGWASMVGISGIEKLFQHTAARRRLAQLFRF